MQRKVLTCHPREQTKAHAREGHPWASVCELSTVCLCFPFCSSCVTQKGGPAVCGANEPITDSLSENDSEETQKKTSGKNQEAFRKYTHFTFRFQVNSSY